MQQRLKCRDFKTSSKNRLDKVSPPKTQFSCFHWLTKLTWLFVCLSCKMSQTFTLGFSCLFYLFPNRFVLLVLVLVVVDLITNVDPLLTNYIRIYVVSSDPAAHCWKLCREHISWLTVSQCNYTFNQSLCLLFRSAKMRNTSFALVDLVSMFWRSAQERSSTV